MQVSWRQLALWAGFALFMLLLPEFVSKGTLRTIIFANFLAIFAISWDVLSGRTGYISFGHPFLIGIGTYTSAILSYRFGVPVSVSIPLAVLATMAFMELMYQLVQVIRPDLTGGTRGISGIQTLTRGAENNFYLSFMLLLCVAFTMWLVMKTRLGTALSAIGMSEESVRGSGLDTTRLKLAAFMMSAFIAGLGGAFYVHYLGSIAPRALFDINFLFTIIVAALIGGVSTVIGPMLGAFFLTFLLEYLRPLLPGAERYFIYGGIALVLYVYQPRGLLHLARQGWPRLREMVRRGPA